ncbi:helix-turn-helix domain-containing protein [Alkaliphilus hydrothermalis]|uniref:Membrane protein n=1 Tax=Alkaliphilus hydrothermalis TaxID=1482730 RepID=A0ABS2NRW1_9FIRM|nr:helix-turn-helix domain-containing protein [Alkaliphilus hydrothermalis]MBM7615705.1 putative membrane protein [Alkaliphilus hydrothermalis]
MEKNKFLTVAIVLLAFSIIFGSIYIGDSIRQVANQSANVSSDTDDILDFDGAAEYLNISKSDLAKIISTRSSTSGIKYVKVKGKYIFSKVALNEWLKNTWMEMD